MVVGRGLMVRWSNGCGLTGWFNFVDLGSWVWVIELIGVGLIGPPKTPRLQIRTWQRRQILMPPFGFIACRQPINLFFVGLSLWNFCFMGLSLRNLFFVGLSLWNFSVLCEFGLVKYVLGGRFNNSGLEFVTWLWFDFGFVFWFWVCDLFVVWFWVCDLFVVLVVEVWGCGQLWLW